MPFVTSGILMMYPWRMPLEPDMAVAAMRRPPLGSCEAITTLMWEVPMSMPVYIFAIPLHQLMPCGFAAASLVITVTDKNIHSILYVHLIKTKCLGINWCWGISKSHRQ